MTLTQTQLDTLEGPLDRRYDALLEQVRGGLEASENQQYVALLRRTPGDSADESVADALADLNLGVIDRHIRELRDIEATRSRRVLREVLSAFRRGSDFPAEKLASPGIVPGVSWSDQLSFWREGYAAVMVTDTAFYRYRHYHQATDTPDGIDYARMAAVVAGLARAVFALAQRGA